MNTKNLKYFVFIILSCLITFSCSDPVLVDYAEGDTVKINNPFLQISTLVVPFQAGIPSYKISMHLVNNEQDVSKVNVYSVFTDAKTGISSNEVLLTSFDVADGNRVLLEKNLTYDDLKKGLKVGGVDLPADQNLLAVGSGWKLRFEGETKFGTEILSGTINVGVLSRFAGIYKVIESHYYRIGVLTATWDGQTRFLGSVDENTFSYNDYWGSFAWAGKSFRFDIDFATNKIKVPIITESGLFSGTRAISCETDEALFAEFDCKQFNVLEPNEATGAHRIKLTYGYFTDGSGPRAFYEILEKVN